MKKRLANSEMKWVDDSPAYRFYFVLVHEKWYRHLIDEDRSSMNRLSLNFIGFRFGVEPIGKNRRSHEKINQSVISWRIAGRELHVVTLTQWQHAPADTNTHSHCPKISKPSRKMRATNLLKTKAHLVYWFFHCFFFLSRRPFGSRDASSHWIINDNCNNVTAIHYSTVDDMARRRRRPTEQRRRCDNHERCYRMARAVTAHNSRCHHHHRCTTLLPSIDPQSNHLAATKNHSLFAIHSSCCVSMDLSTVDDMQPMWSGHLIWFRLGKDESQKNQQQQCMPSMMTTLHHSQNRYSWWQNGSTATRHFASVFIAAIFAQTNFRFGFGHFDD